MTPTQKKRAIKKHVKRMLKDSYQTAVRKIDLAFESGVAPDWNPDDKPMLIPKAMVCAILQSEAEEYDAAGTSFHKQVKQDVKYIKLFL